MPLKTEGVEEPGLNLTPMIDIVFLLIIFFMVGTQFSEPDQRIDVSLPTVSETFAVTSLPDPATVTVTEAGGLGLDGETVSAEELERRLVAMRQEYPGQAVLVRGDAGTSLQHVMDVLAACRRAGVRGISLASRLRPGE